MQTAPRRAYCPKNDRFDDDNWKHLFSAPHDKTQHIDSPYDNAELMRKNSIDTGYTRNSTDKGDAALQDAFIGRQLEDMGMTINETYWFREGVASATKKPELQDREEGKKLHALVSSGAVNRIFVYKLDRLFRKQWAAHEFVALCQKVGTDIISMDSPQGILCDDGFILYSMNFMMAEMEARRLARRTTDGMAVKRESGSATTGAVFGWDISFTFVGENKITKVEPNWQEQAVINWMKARLDEGWSKNKVARALNEVGVRGKNGGKWQSASIQRTLDAKQHQELAKEKTPKRMAKWPFADLRKKQAKLFD